MNKPLDPALTFAYNTDMWYVYIIYNLSKGLYMGCTGDLHKRIEQHNKGKSFYTRGYVWQLVYYEAYLSKEDAFERERQLKYHGQAKAWVKRRIKKSLAKVSAG